MRTFLLLLPVLLFLLNSCKSDSEADKSAPATEATTKYTNSQGTLISNGIALETKGVQVLRAFLIYDNSTLVPPGNKTSEGRPVKLRLEVEEGWTEDEGQVSIGASETILTNKGQVVLNEKDLFATTPLLDAKAAKTITLTATIDKLGKMHNQFIVSFRVWDKKGYGEIKGTYKLYVE